jgi:hypothetical protein
MHASSSSRSLRRATRYLVLAIGAALTLTVGVMAPAQAAGTVTGRVVADATGADLAGMTVHISKKKVPEPDDIKWDDIATHTSDRAGQFSFAELSPGTYMVSVSNWEGSVGYLPIVGSEFTVPASGTVALSTFRLVVGGKVTGTLSREGGGSAAGLGVMAWGPVGSADPDIMGHAYADASGAYTLKGLRTAGYRLEFFDTSGTHLKEFWDSQPTYQQATDLDVAATATVAGIDATLARGGTISGQVKGDDSGKALAGIQVNAYTLEEATGSWEFSGVQAVTDSDGHYSVVGLPTGVTHLGFTDPAEPGRPGDRTSYDSEFFGDEPTQETAIGIEVTAGAAITGRDASLAPRGSIAGTITGTGGSSVAKGQAVLYEGTEEEGGTWWRPVASGPTNASGQYEIRNVPAGSYHLQFWDMEGVHQTEYFGDVAGHEGARPVVAASGQRYVADASLVVDDTLPPLTRWGLPNITSATPPEVGTSLSAYHGSWEPYDGTEYAYEWLRGGTVRVGVGETYTPTAEDLGSTLAVRVVAFGPGHRPSSATSGETSPVQPAKISTPPEVTPPVVTPPDVTPPVVTPVVPPAPYTPPVVTRGSASVKVSAKGAKKKATLTITVKASGVTPTGKVTIKLGSKTLKTVTLRGGKAKVTLTKQKRGKRTYKVIYSGDSRVRTKTVNSKKVAIT